MLYFFAVFLILLTNRSKSFLGISWPLTFTRSQTEKRWGDVKRPVLKPQLRNADSIKVAVEPLPFVPAIRITLDNFSCGFPIEYRNL